MEKKKEIPTLAIPEIPHHAPKKKYFIKIGKDIYRRLQPVGFIYIKPVIHFKPAKDYTPLPFKIALL